MDNDNSTKFVAFDKYCGDCKFATKSATSDPCNDCLNVGAREGTEVPEYFEKKER